MNEEADFAYSAVGATQERYRVVDFSQSVIFDYIELLTPRGQLLPAWQSPVR